MSPHARHAPATAAEVHDIVAAAVADRGSLEVRGGGSKRSMRLPVEAAARLDTRSLTGVTDYDPEELVITARAGTPLAEIEAVLQEREQMLAFEPFDHGPLFGAAPGSATLGGIIAANVSGPRRLSSGAARDHILGFTAVSGRGETLKGGGAVVKNVTGFDLPKLMAGSFGTLAVFISLTLRVLPRPRAETTLLFRELSDETANALMCTAMATPAAVSSAAHLPLPDAVTALRLEGFGPAVEARCRELLRVLRPVCAGEAIAAQGSRAFWQGVRTLEALPCARHVLWRVSVPPAHGWRVPALLECPVARYLYDWAGALVWVAIPEHAPHAADWRVRTVARSLGGHAQLTRAPHALREAMPLETGRDPALERLHQRVKAAFDPFGVLNPGVDLAADL